MGDNKERSKPSLVTKDAKISKIFSGAYFCGYFTESGKVWLWGDNSTGQLNLGDNRNRNEPTLVLENEQVKQICCGYRHLLLLTSDGSLFSCGWNAHKQLCGTADQFSVNTLTFQMKDVVFVACGAYHSLVLLKSATILYYGLGGSKYTEKNNILTRDGQEVKIMMGEKVIPCVWSHSLHHRFPNSTKKRVFCFLLSLFSFRQRTGVKPPKPIVYIIINLSL